MLRDPGMSGLRWGTDTYQMRTLSSIFDFLLIDRPLARYVRHQTNYFLKGAPLYNALFFDFELEKRDTFAVTKFAVKRLMSEVGQPCLRYEDPQMFFQAMQALSGNWPGVPPEGRGQSFYVERLRANRKSPVAAFGAQTVDWEIKRTYRDAAK